MPKKIFDSGENRITRRLLVLAADAVLLKGKDSMRSDRIVSDCVRSVVQAGAAADGTQGLRIVLRAPSK